MKVLFLYCVIIMSIILLWPSESHAQWGMVLTEGTFQSLAVNDMNLFAGTTTMGFFRFNKNGTNWTQLNHYLPTKITAVAVMDTHYFAGTAAGFVYHSTINNPDWKPTHLPVVFSEFYPDVRAFTVHGTYLFAGTYGEGVFLSTDKDTSWIAANTGLTNLRINVLAVIPPIDGSGDTTFFAGTDGGGVFFSTNKGNQWTKIMTGLPDTVVHALVGRDTNLFAGTDSGVFCYSKNGKQWTGVHAGLANIRVNALAVIDTILFAGTAGSGVFYSTDNGIHWIEYNTGLTHTNIITLIVSGTTLFAGITPDGLWQRSLYEFIPLPHVDWQPTFWNYGRLYVSYPCSAKTFSISNKGTADLQVTSTSIAYDDASEFHIISGGGTFTLAPGAVHPIVVWFCPLSYGQKDAYLIINTNDPVKVTFGISVCGFGDLIGY